MTTVRTRGWLIAGALTACAIASAPTGAAERVVLLENFTSSSCGYCVPVGQAVDRLVDTYPDTVACLQYHITDSYETPFARQRQLFYGVPGTPVVWIDGIESHWGSAGSEQQNYEAFEDDYMRRLTKPSECMIDVFGEHIGGQQYEITCKVRSEEGAPTTDLVVYMVQVLDHFPIGAHYRNCVVKNAVPTPITLGSGEEETVTWTLTLTGSSWVYRENVNIVAWVQRPAASGPALVEQAAKDQWPFTPLPITCAADMNGSNVVDVADLLLLFSNWGHCEACICDFNGDDVVDVADLLEVFAQWGACP